MKISFFKPSLFLPGILTVMCMSVVDAFSQRGRESAVQAKFDELTYDFGNIKETDGKVSHDFEFTNESNRPYIIEYISVSCGCTTPDYDKAPVMPGGKGKITITYDPAGRPGIFDKTVVVTSNNRRDQATLRVTGSVTGRPRTVEDDFPVELGNGLRSTSTTFLFGYLPRGKKVTQSVNIINNGAAPIDLDFSVVDKGNGYVSVRANPKVLAPQGRGTIDFSYDMTTADIWGLLNTVFQVMANGKPGIEAFSAYATVVEDFTKLTDDQLRNAPRADFSSRLYHFGEVKQGEKPTHEFSITNTGRSPLHIRNIKPNSSFITYVIDNTTIGVGETTTIKATLDTTGKTGRVSESISMVVNDRDGPLKEIRLMAVVTE